MEVDTGETAERGVGESELLGERTAWVLGLERQKSEGGTTDWRKGEGEWGGSVCAERGRGPLFASLRSRRGSE